MSRVLKRPMFRKGGEAMGGIMSKVKPRQNYSIGQRVEEYQNIMKAATAGVGSGRGDALTRFLIETGQGLVGGAGAGRGSKLAEIIGATEKPTQNLFAALEKEKALDKQIGLSAATLGIKGEQAIEKAKAASKFQKEFSPDRKEYELFKEYSNPNVKTFKKSIRQIFPKAMARFDAKTSANLDNVEEFKGKNVQVFPSKISGDNATFDFNRMIPGTLYFRPDQQNSIFERDPENEVIIQYNIFTGDILKKIPIGG